MERKIPLVLAFISASVLFYFHTLGLRSDYYWLIWWFDILMHFLGGATLGFLGFTFFKKINAVSVRRVFVYGNSLTLFFALIWEVIELASKITFIAAEYWLDATGDILAAITGSSLSIALLFRILTPSGERNF